jgi:hypothetical protein
LVIAVALRHKDTNRAFRIADAITCAIEREPRALEELTVLRIRKLRLCRGYPEERCVEVIGVIENSLACYVAVIIGAFRGDTRGQQVLAGDGREGLPPCTHIIPELVRGIGARDATPDSDNCNVTFTPGDVCGHC